MVAGHPRPVRRGQSPPREQRLASRAARRSLPQFGSMAYQAGEVGRFAREVERAGAASVWVGDLLLSPLQPKLGYEGAPDLPDQFRAQLDPLVQLTTAAIATERVRLGTSVLTAPW